MNTIKSGVILLLAGILLASFSELIVDVLQIERDFGKEPLSLKLVRFGLIAAVLGFGIMLYGGWKNWRAR